MNQQQGIIKSNTQEFVFLCILYVLVFVFYSFERDHSEITIQKSVYFLTYLSTSLFISYVLLPKYFYTKKYAQFFVGLLLSIAFVMLVEELVLEQIFFPDTRAKRFPGVLFTLTQILPIIVIMSGFKFAWDALYNQKKVERMTTLIKESELSALKYQINPHFLFNNLNNIYSFALESSPITPQLIIKLSDILRYRIYDCDADRVWLSQEVQHLKNVVEINRLQIEGRGEANLCIDGPLGHFHICPLILDVFVENAFKHSMNTLTNGIKIDILLRLKDNNLYFKCSNKYNHHNVDDNRFPKGIGLENVRKRLEFLYGNQYNLIIQHTDELYTVQLSILL